MGKTVPLTQGELRQMPKLKPAIKKRWLKALRSGTYKQGTGALCQTEGGTGFCCLGVLCDVVANDKAVKEAGLGWESVEWESAEEGGWWEFGGADGDLPSALFPIILKDPNALSCGGWDDEVFAPLMARNDGHKMAKHSFEQLADLIEKHL